MSEYLEFVEVANLGKKTKVVRVNSKRSGATLGMIHWWGAWRQYVYAPSFSEETILNPGCMDDISAKCREMTKTQLKR